MDIGFRIRDYMESHGIKQTWLSEKAHIPMPKLNLSLSGKRKLTFEEYQTICWALGVGVDTFLSPMPPLKVASGTDCG